MKVRILREKNVANPQASYVHCAHGDGTESEAAPARVCSDRTLPVTADGGASFYNQLNRLLDEGGFDDFVEQQCAGSYAERMGRPSLSPGR